MTTEDDVKEVLQRMIRVESRIVQLGDFVGANLRTKQRISIVTSNVGVAVEIDSMDVSLSRIYSELTKYGWDGNSSVPVFCKHQRIATLLALS